MNVESKVKVFLEKIQKGDGKINAFLEVNSHVLEEARVLDAKKGKKGRLYGKVIAVKSNINVKGLTCSCASKTLEGYRATYDATVIEKIKAEDGLIIGMTNMDEFAAGWSGETSAFGPTINPRVPGHVAGGSSSGSAAAVAAGFCDMALGSETGGSTRVPASFCGIVGVKPSYGAVSRYGLIDLSMSLDQIASLARTVDDAALLLDVISGKDEKDCRSATLSSVKVTSSHKLRVGIIRLDGVPVSIQRQVESCAEKVCAKHGWKQSVTELDHLHLGIQTYFPIVWTEFFSATRRFDGRRYGKRIEEVAGKEVLRRIYGGSEIVRAESAGRYYFKALRVKDLIRQEFDNAFTEFDVLITPTSAVLPFKLGSKVSFDELALIDLLTCPVNLAGVCALSVPSGTVEGKPAGLQVIAGYGKEALLFHFARALEKTNGNLKN
ncbi:MAG: amidase family protein [Nanoarchaeota archaeon]